MMKKTVLFLLGFFLLIVSGFCPVMAEPDYIWTQQENGLAQFELDGKIGLMDSDGKVICPAIYDGMSYFDEYGYAKVYQSAGDATQRDDMGIIDENGDVIIPPGAYEILAFRPPTVDEGKGFFVAVVIGEWSLSNDIKFLTCTGEQISESLWFTYVQSGTGIFVTLDKKTWYLFDESGVKYPYEFYEIERVQSSQRYYRPGYGYQYFPEERYVGYAKTDKGYVEVNDTGLITKEYVSCGEDFVLHAAYDEQGQQIALVDDYEDMFYFDEYDLYRVKKQGLCGILSGAMEVLVPYAYESIYPVQIGDDYGFVGTYEGKETLLDRHGVTIVPLQWDELILRNGYIRIVSEGKMGVVDNTGAVVIEPLWDGIEANFDTPYVYKNSFGIPFSNGWEETENTPPAWYYVFCNEGVGILSKDGEIIIEPIWENMLLWENDTRGNPTFCVKKDEKNYMLSMSGEVLQELEYSYTLPGTSGTISNDKSLRIVSAVDEEWNIHSWTLFDNHTNELLWSYPHDEFSFPYAENASQPSFFDNPNIMTNIEYHGEKGFIDREGTIITNSDWETIWNGFSDNGLAFVEVKNGKYGVIDLKGNYIFPAILDVGSMNSSTGQDFFAQGAHWYARVGTRDANGKTTYGYINELGQSICGVKLPEQ